MLYKPDMDFNKSLEVARHEILTIGNTIFKISPVMNSFPEILYKVNCIDEKTINDNVLDYNSLDGESSLLGVFDTRKEAQEHCEEYVLEKP